MENETNSFLLSLRVLIRLEIQDGKRGKKEKQGKRRKKRRRYLENILKSNEKAL